MHICEYIDMFTHISVHACVCIERDIDLRRCIYIYMCVRVSCIYIYTDICLMHQLASLQDSMNAPKSLMGKAQYSLGYFGIVSLPCMGTYILGYFGIVSLPLEVEELVRPCQFMWVLW